MRHFIALFLLSICFVAHAEPRARQIQFMCGTEEQALVTIQQYGEKLITATLAPNKRTVNLLYINFATQTSSWFIHDLQTDEYCMMGVGDQIYIPKESPLDGFQGVIHTTQR